VNDFKHKVLANKVNMEIVHSIYKVTKHIITRYIYKFLSIVFTKIIINTRGYELYKYFTMVQSFEAFIEEKNFNNSCFMDLLDVVPVPVCVQYMSTTYEIEGSADYCLC
jgi:hypothetical protein